MPETRCSTKDPLPLERPWSREHVHASRGDEKYVAVPPLADAVELAHRNRERLATSCIDVQGRELSTIRRWARREVLREARQYTDGLLSEAPLERHAEFDKSRPENQPPGSSALYDAAETALYVGGHQPTLFHPGVWVKNFVVGGLAQHDRAIGLNLVVDTDTLSGTTVRVPTGMRDAPRMATIAFDEPRPRQPWEEAKIANRDLFGSFAERTTAAMANCGFSALLPDFWPAAVRRSTRTDSLAECLTAARSAWERSWGLSNLELPVSRLCTIEPFLWFSAHLLAHLPRFQAVYNEVLREFRLINRVRSRMHPVPDLREDDGWFEAPFRVWRAGDHVRRPVFARQFEGEIRLSDGETIFAELPLSPGKDACCAVAELQKLAPQGIRFRTRALTTTMFARLCFADLFVHGIGGSKYDQMTDRIVARFFGLAAPEFLTMSATLQLPVPDLPVVPEDNNRLQRQLRELDYNSDRHLPSNLSAAERGLVAEKLRLINEQNSIEREPPPMTEGAARNTGAGYDRFRRLQQVNRQLAALTQGNRRRIEEELSRTRQQLAANSIWHDREYAFCLYPAEKLKRFMNHVCTSTLG